MKEARIEMIRRPAPVYLIVACFFRPPKSRKGRFWKTQRPDLDKLIRALGDSLSGICFEDDSQVAMVYAAKIFGPCEKITAKVSTLPIEALYRLPELPTFEQEINAVFDY